VHGAVAAINTLPQLVILSKASRIYFPDCLDVFLYMPLLLQLHSFYVKEKDLTIM